MRHFTKREAMNYTIPMLAIMLASCVVVEEDKRDTGSRKSNLSECGQQVLRASEYAYTDCFDGDEMYGACETCGFYPSKHTRTPLGPADCITCEEGHTIDVVFSDCTGYCVPHGALYANATPDSCNAISECVYEEW